METIRSSACPSDHGDEIGIDLDVYRARARSYRSADDLLDPPPDGDRLGGERHRLGIEAREVEKLW